jgi:hypothetical protein
MAPAIYLLNNTGTAAWVLSAEGDGDPETSERLGDWFFGLARVGDGRGMKIMYHNVAASARFRLQVGSCVLGYTLPPLDTSHNEVAVVQIQPDLRIYLIADGVWRANPNDRRPFAPVPHQLGAFPVEADSYVCE